MKRKALDYENSDKNTEEGGLVTDSSASRQHAALLVCNRHPTRKNGKEDTRAPAAKSSLPVRVQEKASSLA